MTDPKHTEPVVVVTSNDSMCGGLYPVHGSVTHGRTVECCDFCGLPADYEPARTAAEAASRQEVERLREALRWTLAELNGATRYDNDEQRENCLADAEAALSNTGEATAPWWQWYHAIDDALVCAHIGTADSFPDAKTALHKLICWEIDVALDPHVSERAQSLIADSKAQENALRETLARVATALPVLERLLTVAGLESGAGVARALGSDVLDRLGGAVCSADGCHRREPCGPFCRDNGNFTSRAALTASEAPDA